MHMPIKSTKQFVSCHPQNEIIIITLPIASMYVPTYVCRFVTMHYMKCQGVNAKQNRANL